MYLALTDLFQAKWTEEIHREWIYNIAKKQPNITKHKLQLVKEKMNMNVRDCLVDGYQKLTQTLTLPDPNDRHVLAAAIYANADLIVTFNLRDFPIKFLSRYRVQAKHPDEFIVSLLSLNTAKVIDEIRKTRLSLKNPSKSPEEYLAILERQSLPKTVTYLRKYIEHI